MMKAIGYGIIGFVVFFFINAYVVGGLAQTLLIGGDEFTLSYHAVSYSGIALLGGIMITCTYIIVSKINEIKK